MIKRDRNTKGASVRTFRYKWYIFLNTYILMNVYFFFGSNGTINSIYKNFSDFYVTDFSMDGSDLSPIMNLFSMPLFLIISLVTVLLFIAVVFVFILIFRLLYFLSTVNADDLPRLNRYINRTIVFLIFPGILGTMFYGDIGRLILFILLYLPVPLFTFLLISLKMKKLTKAVSISKAVQLL